MEGNSDRRDLYEEFESEVVKRGNIEAFFDEDDLVEIFDYASDYDNYIVKMEVLLYGARHYPKSEALATRRAWLYYSFGETEAGVELNRRLNKNGVLNRLLDLKSRNLNGSLSVKQKIEALNEILDSTVDFEDEEIIQFTDYAIEEGLSDWLWDKKNLIISKCSYPQTFLYEFASQIEDTDSSERASSLYEELTMMEPFNIDFWLCLATAQLANNNSEGAYSSADYALAIDPHSVKAKRIKAASLFGSEDKKAEVIELYNDILKEDQYSDSDVAALGMALVQSERVNEAKSLIKKYLLSHPDSRPAVDILMLIDQTEAEPYVRAMMDSESFTEEDAINWAKDHFMLRHNKTPGFLLLLYHEIKGVEENLPFLVDAAYYAERYEDIVRLDKENDLMDTYWQSPAVTLCCIMAYARIGLKQEGLDKTRSLIEKIKSLRHAFSNFDFVPIFQMPPATSGVLVSGYLVTLSSLESFLKSDNSDPDSYDPIYR